MPRCEPRWPVACDPVSAPDATKPVGAGSVLCSRYRLLRLVAQGGMASVWEAHDNVLARSVAVKMLHPHLAADSLFLERFRREAISAARLAHPNVVATFDAGISDEGTAFIVMELIRGQTLSAFATEHRPLPIFVCVEIAMQIADALAHAHAAGLVHRDIKPANVLVCDTESDGVPLIKVTDFGIAKAAEGLGLELTKTGMILGTPKYLSPEQIEGREPDARADLYALGVVLFELVAGLAPFRGPTEMAVAVQHLNDAPARLRDVRPTAPAALDLLVAALLAKQPQDRPPSAVAVRQALARIDVSGGRHPAPSPAPGPAGPSRPAGSTAVGTPRPAPPRAGSTTTPSQGSPPRPSPAGARPFRQGPPPPPPTSRPASARSAPTRPPRRPNWTGRMVAALVVAAIVVVIVVLSNQGGGRSPSTGPGGPAGTTAALLSIHNVSVFHLERDADGAAHVDYAIDGNPNTAWQTDRYFGSHFANLRHGLGLALTLDTSATLHSLTVTSSTTGWSAEIYIADSVPNPPSLAPWGAPVDSKQNIAGSTTFDLHNQSGRAILVWLTDLGPTFQASIAEVSVR
ncbi:MAG: eukaryotic-like serine/threonine-protein kinase [Acidimicrobiaceae bacterium]|nr:eukaryotic-like serine/threonine-protein kinase [Acidimicrobiaceae bacterium]